MIRETGPSAHENAAGIALLDGVAAQTDTASRALVDQGFKKSLVDHGIDFEIVERNSADKVQLPYGAMQTSWAIALPSPT